MFNLKIHISVLVFSLVSFSLKAQQKDLEIKDVQVQEHEVEPEFPGGQEAFFKYVASKIVYPQDCRDNMIQGKVYISFVIDTDGSVSDVIVIRGVHQSIDQEAVRVIKSSPKWKPGTINGKPVKVKYTYPISFKLT